MYKFILNKKNYRKNYIKYILIKNNFKILNIIIGKINKKIFKISLHLNNFTYWISKNIIFKSYLLYKFINNNCKFFININKKYEKIKY